MRYILLLRGINVGGKNKVVMRELSVLLTDAGFEEVGSYINSGNLFFGSDEPKEHCISKIRALLEAQYDFPIPFALLTKEEYLEERAALPAAWTRTGYGTLSKKPLCITKLCTSGDTRYSGANTMRRST